MKFHSSVIAVAIAAGLTGCGETKKSAPDARAVEPEVVAKPVKSAGEKMNTIPASQESAWTWGYFLATDRASAEKLAEGHKHTLTLYKVDKVVPVRGEPVAGLAADAPLVRLEMAVRLNSLPQGKSALFLQGLPEHLQYTTRAQRDDLNARARSEVPASKDAVAVIIPIRKSAAWWALPHDERTAHFHKGDKTKGHTAIGADYVPRIYRKLYHTRYAVETRDHDFITYFEFQREHEADFKRLLAELRDETKNPEWKFVDREYEIWTTKVE